MPSRSQLCAERTLKYPSTLRPPWRGCWLLGLLLGSLGVFLLPVMQVAYAQTQQPLFYYENGRRIAVQPDYRQWTVGRRVNYSPQTQSNHGSQGQSANQPALTPLQGWQSTSTQSTSSGDLLHIWKNPHAPAPQVLAPPAAKFSPLKRQGSAERQAAGQGTGLNVAPNGPQPTPTPPAGPTPLDNSNVEWAYPALLEAGSAAPIYVSPEVVIEIRPGITAAQVQAQLPGWLEWIKIVAGVPTLHLVRLRNPRGQHPILAANRLLDELDWVLNAQPNFMRQLKTHYRPNDTHYNDQWHLNNPHSSTTIGGGVALNGGDYTDHDSRIETAWDTTLGNSGVVIAIIDNGLERNHPDLRVVNGLSRNYCVSPASTTLDDGEHGTPVAGVAAGVGNNGIGISGACPNCSVFGVQMLADSGCRISDSRVASALAYAARHADILNNSWGSSGGTVGLSLRTVISQIYQGTLPRMKRAGLGAPIVFAAGNSASHWTLATLSPAGSGSNVVMTMRYIQNATPNTTLEPGYTLGETAIVGGIFDINPSNGTLSHHHRFANRFANCLVPSSFSAVAGSNTNWGVTANDALVDSFFGGRCSLMAGRIGLSQSSGVRFDLTIPVGSTVFFQYWVSSHRLECPLGNPSCANPSVAAPEVIDGVGCRTQDHLEITARRGTGSVETFRACGYAAPDGGPVVYGRTSPQPALPETIAVGAASIHNTRSGYSQWGPSLDLVAHSSGGIAFVPGRNTSIGRIVTTFPTTSPIAINSTRPVGYTGGFSGTSSAAPLVAGAIGLYLSRYPQASAADVTKALRQSARKIGNTPYDANGHNHFYGYGLLDATRLLAASPNSSNSSNSTEDSSSDGCLLVNLHQAGYVSAQQLQHMRRLRDWLLAQGHWGRALVGAYYRFSFWVASLPAQSSVPKRDLTTPWSWLHDYTSAAGSQHQPA